MSSNKHVKDEMIRTFGKKCFIEELHLRSAAEIEKERRKYTSKGQRRIMDMLTYHHIVERCRGGKATIENGAILRNINHQWLHRLPQNQRDYINQLLQEYKRQFYHKTEVQFVEELDSGLEIDIAEIEPTHKGLKGKKKGVYNRAKRKREDRKELEELE